jgi:hypothetical protein
MTALCPECQRRPAVRWWEAPHGCCSYELCHVCHENLKRYLAHGSR